MGQVDEELFQRGFPPIMKDVSAEVNSGAGEPESLRRFPSGATRDTDHGKLDYDGFLSPLVVKRYAQYMHVHRVQSDGTMRDSDNWQRGIPPDEYRKSAWRHFMDWWWMGRGWPAPSTLSIEDAACALLFNVMGWLHERLKSRAT